MSEGEINSTDSSPTSPTEYNNNININHYGQVTQSRQHICVTIPFRIEQQYIPLFGELDESSNSPDSAKPVFLSLLVHHIIHSTSHSITYAVTIESSSDKADDAGMYALKIQDDDLDDIKAIYSKTSIHLPCPILYAIGKVHDRNAILMESMTLYQPISQFIRHDQAFSCATTLRIGLVLLDQLQELWYKGCDYADISIHSIGVIVDHHSILSIRFLDNKIIPLCSYVANSESWSTVLGGPNDSVCSVLFLLISLLGGTLWSDQVTSKVSSRVSNNLILQYPASQTRTRGMYRYDKSVNSTKFVNSTKSTNSTKSVNSTKSTRVMNLIKVNTLLTMLYDAELIDAKTTVYTLNSHMLESMIRAHFQTIHQVLCQRYIDPSKVMIPKYRCVIGLYLLAIWSTMNTLSGYQPDIEFTRWALNLLNIKRICSLEEIYLVYDYRYNMFNIDLNKVYAS